MAVRWQRINVPEFDQRGAAAQNSIDEEGTLAGRTGERLVPSHFVVV